MLHIQINSFYHYNTSFKCNKPKVITKTLQKNTQKPNNVKKEALESLIETKKTISEMAEALNCTKYYIYKLFEFFDLTNEYQKMKKTKQAKIDIPRDQFTNLVREGKNIEELKEIFNCSTSAISKFLVESNLIDEYKLIQKTKKIIPFDKLSQLVREGKSTKELKDIFNCSISTIRKTLIKYNLLDEYLRIYQQKKKKYNIQKTELKNLLETGKNLKEIADYYKCSSSTVIVHINLYELNDIHQKNCEKRNENRFRIKVPPSEILELIKAGKQSKEIAEIYNCKEMTIYKYFYKHNLLEEYEKSRAEFTKKKEEEFLKQLNVLLNEGLPVNQIAKILNCSTTKIRKRLFDPQKNKFYTNIPTKNTLNKTELEQLIMEEIPLTQIADIFNCDVGSIYRALKKFDLEKEYQRLINEKATNTNITTKNEITLVGLKNLIDRGYNFKGMAKYFNTTTTNIHSLIISYNLLDEYVKKRSL